MSSVVRSTMSTKNLERVSYIPQSRGGRNIKGELFVALCYCFHHSVVKTMLLSQSVRQCDPLEYARRIGSTLSINLELKHRKR